MDTKSVAFSVGEYLGRISVNNARAMLGLVINVD